MLTLNIKDFNAELLEQTFDDNQEVKVVFDKDISKDDLISTLKCIFDYENSILEENKQELEKIMSEKKEDEVIKDIEQKDIPNIYINAKSLSNEMIIELFRYSLSRDDILNSTVILNIFNLIKTYNSFDKSYFENEFIFVSDLEPLLVIKQGLNDEIKKFIRELTIWFYSLFKSINKVEYTFLDEHYELPTIFKRMFQVTDLVTIAGIINKSPEFSSSELKNVDNAMYFVSDLSKKLVMGNTLLEMFLNDNSKGTENNLQ